MDSTVYYGVYMPNETRDSDLSVFQDKVEALKLMKKNKKARFKAFQFYHEAAEFSLNGSECPNNNSHTVDGVLFMKKAVENSVQAVGEKANPFKVPKSQDLVELRKAIETGNYKLVKDTIWQNPRYLVGNGDTPSILQEGPRYNALHVAAKARKGPMAELILNTISNLEFMKLLYGDDNLQNAKDRAYVLLDLYLNTPNKGNNETPLHFASKYAAPEVVEVLVSYSQCDKTLKNRYRQTAEMIICDRSEDKSAETKRKIEILLQDNYYVPVLRTEDNSLPPTVGEPFSPTSPPMLNRDPLSPRLEIHAYAGPMDMKHAQEFRKVWKTPPRSLRPNNATPEFTNLRFRDPEKGLERIGKQLASQYAVSWKEYWPFLDSFLDITSEEGLNALEKYLLSKQPVKYFKSPQSINQSADQSLVTKLCNAFNALNLSDQNEPEHVLDRNDQLVPIVHIEKACEVFANRLTNILLYLLCEYDNIVTVLETEMKHLELAITSYMDDVRFASVNFQKVHPRLGALIGERLLKNIKLETRQSLCDRIENLLESVVKSLDCFSSDDEGMHLKEILKQRKPTIYRKQIICLVQFIQIVLVQNSNDITNNGDINVECSREWENCTSCMCVYHLRKAKKSNLSRNSSIKYKSNKFGVKNGQDNISRKLCFDDDDFGIKESASSQLNDLNNSLITNNYTDTSSDDEYYTPPSSPSFIEDDSWSASDNEEEFIDTELPTLDIYIEGFSPTRTDYAVYNAMLQSKCVINKDKYPNIYKWRHRISLYSEKERKSWSYPRHSKNDVPTSPMNGSQFNNDSICEMSTPTKSWLRITGANSPRVRLKQ